LILIIHAEAKIVNIGALGVEFVPRVAIILSLVVRVIESTARFCAEEASTGCVCAVKAIVGFTSERLQFAPLLIIRVEIETKAV
jgi:hypothetical protein